MRRPKQQELRQPELRQGEHGIPMGNKLCQEFWEEQPQVWFNLLERKFDEYQIESNSRKSSLLLSRLTQKALLAVQDLIDDNDTTYEQIKTRLLNHFGDSVQHKVTKLFSCPPQMTKKPSEILAELRTIFPSNSMTDEALKPLFISRLPYFVQLQLSARFTEPLPQLVREADGVAGFVNNTQALHPFLSQNPAEPIVNAVSSKNSLLEAQRENALLKKQISQLEEKLGEFSGANQHADGRSQPIQYSVPNRRTNYSKNKTYARRNPSGRNWIDSSVAGKSYESSSKNLCYYHYTFGTNAHKCQPPCNWHKVVSKNLNASPDH